MPKKEETPKLVLERVYIIPLRRETLKVPPFKKANKAVKTIRAFISRHMKSDNVVIGKYLNLAVWNHGAKNPPHKVKVNAAKDDKGKVFVELVGAPKEEPKAEEKKKVVKKEEKKAEEKPEEKLEKQVEEIKEEKAEEAKKIEQEEIKELKKEHPKVHAPKAPQKPKMQETHPTAPRSV
ncbi:60S ribosomal protein L31 [Candidatus Woesearchaeota archaeon]|nr:60S ribosomal protein L31 [Candidatus Woesearchaeota archaeon]